MEKIRSGISTERGVRGVGSPEESVYLGRNPAYGSLKQIKYKKYFVFF